jgi:flagellar hook protein FlgE
MSFYTSLTGLNAAAAELAVVSNNIANSTTTSFKRSETTFGDIFALSTSSNPSTAKGSGVRVIGIDQQFSQGSFELTENSLDIAISGDGFFPMAASDGRPVYTRNGSFLLNKDDQVVNSSGLIVQVFPLKADGTSDFNRDLQNLTVNRSVPAQATTTIGLDIKLPDAAAVIGANGGTAIDPADKTTYNQSQVISLYDDAGESYAATVYYQKIGNDVVNGAVTEDQWRASVYVGDPAVLSNNVAFSFDQDGAIIAPIADQVIAASAVDGRAQDITLTLSALTHTKIFEVTAQTTNGAAKGELTNINIEEGGAVVATYSNGAQVASGRIILAKFTSPAGLSQEGNTVYSATAGSGTLAFGEPGSSGVGKLASGAKERSNVDVTAELVDLIAAQRNFQSNAKALETSGSLASTLINMRG